MQKDLDRKQYQESLPKTDLGISVTIHGHFYQPPRENPYLNEIERQPSAAPYHNWNERIARECYRPNAFARVLNDRGEIIGIVNNYEYLSFNIGATLMAWLERYDPQVYQRIIDADRQSCHRLNGHGNAIAQVYNHIIMPLANERDKITQIRWGKFDFKSRFGRDPEGMWLAETAIDYPTVTALINEGIKFTILAPSQAQRCRPLPTSETPDPEWQEVGGSQIDPTRPYRCFIEDGRYLDIFFYDGPISRDMGFSDVLSSSNHLGTRLAQAIQGDNRPSQILSVATDGETFGHHKGGTEKTLAYAFLREFPERGWSVTNYSHYLNQHPPTWEVQLKPVTAWSCAHGVDRWQDDCGCGSGGGLQQKWRRPLRDSLNHLRDRLIEIYETDGHQFFKDPWAVRDEYIAIISDRFPESVTNFLTRHQTHPLDDYERVSALRLLEMQRHALLMFTSCGWFFEEISRPEGTQILRYASRAIELAREITGIDLEPEFIEQLEKAPSNVELFRTGAGVYHRNVLTAQVSLEQVAAHYAIGSLFNSYSTADKGLNWRDRTNKSNGLSLYCYNVEQRDYQLQRMGALTLAVGEIELTSEIIGEKGHFIFALLHLGGWDFHCCVQTFSNRRAYLQVKESLSHALQRASAASVIVAMERCLGEQTFSLDHLLAQERHRIMMLLSQETLNRVDQLYTQVYRDNYSILRALHRENLPAPRELQVAAEIALSHRCFALLGSLKPDNFASQEGSSVLLELEVIASESANLHCRLNIPEGKDLLERSILVGLLEVLENEDPSTLNADLDRLERLINVGRKLQLGISLAQCQELYFSYLHHRIIPRCFGSLPPAASELDVISEPDTEDIPAPVRLDLPQSRRLLRLGEKLAIDVRVWLERLE
ncbi:DUF3536 domain-containing protein [Roseofilum casamattae]|uniref:DUF3536 domain-containing protein n=1 Tax=Roseofilum casamattae BLCC-M143 TaxID=3022442 RepID=A0ABT7BX95_9CYAN|nr:DUF3536 domain-containing protein [Roseofilum casamattae BLCC-M143]